MFFTQEDFRKIEDYIKRKSIKDTQFDEAITPLDGEEEIAFVQNGKNVKAHVKDIVEQLFLLGVSDFVNVTDKYNQSYINLKEAIDLIPFLSRKKGQVITFINKEGDWVVYQFKGYNTLQWNNTTLWVNLFESIYINSIFPDEEDLTKTDKDEQGNVRLKFKDKVYDPENFSGLGRVYLRKNIMEGKNVLLQEMISEPNTIYHIQYDYDLNGETITIPEGCILQFNGGSINNGYILGNKTIVDSIPTYIFKDVIFEGTFEGEFHVEYIGASMKNEDNSSYFNKAFSSIIKHWVAKSSFYKVNNSIIINNKSFLTFKCDGEIIATKGIDVFKFIGKYNNHIIFDVYAIKTDEPPISSNENHTQYDYDNLSGAAVTIASNFYNSTLKIDHIFYFKYGLHMLADNFIDYHVGIQYMKFYFQYIECTTCIFFDYKDTTRGSWINENQFFGGRLTGNYGILTSDVEFYDVINSNNFYKVGFEGINTCAIKLSGVNKWKLYDLRMHEAIYNKPYINFNDCRDIELSTTVYMDETYVEAIKTTRTVLHTELNDIFLEYKNDKQEIYNSSIYKTNLYRYYDETSDIVENGVLNIKLIDLLRDNSLFLPNVFTYTTYNITTIIDATTFPVTYTSKDLYNLNTHIKFKLRGNGKVIFKYKNKNNSIIETPPYSSQDIDLCYNYDYELQILPASYYINRITITDTNPIILSGNSFIIAESEEIYIKNTNNYIVLLQNNSPCKVHYSINTGDNYKIFNKNPGTSIILETEIENITMYPAGDIKPNNTVMGYQFFDTTLNKPIWWNGNNWIDSEGNNINSIIKIGTFTQKPSNPSIGFAYFCTDRQTTEGSRNGIMIYYAGDDTWVDALGRVIS